MVDTYDLIIIGAGPAGYTAGIYASRGGLKVLILSGKLPGGQLVNTTDVENYPGFDKGILGPDLMKIMRKQTENMGTTILDKTVIDVDFTKRPFKVSTSKETFIGKSAIICTGADPRKLGLEEEKTFSGRGVSYCALCDGPLFKDKELFVIGGGDAAMEEANFLTKFATKVHVVHRRDKLKASKAMQDKVFANKKIEFHWDSEVAGIKGDKMVDSIIIKNSKTNKETTLPTGGIFVSIGHVPNTVLFKDKVELDKMGYIALKESMQTSVPGVFAAGDVHDPTYRQAVTAAAYGCMAALEAERFLDKDN